VDQGVVCSVWDAEVPLQELSEDGVQPSPGLIRGFREPKRKCIQSDGEDISIEDINHNPQRDLFHRELGEEKPDSLITLGNDVLDMWP
jgi:hypothetical protein